MEEGHNVIMNNQINNIIRNIKNKNNMNNEETIIDNSMMNAPKEETKQQQVAAEASTANETAQKNTKKGKTSKAGMVGAGVFGAAVGFGASKATAAEVEVENITEPEAEEEVTAVRVAEVSDDMSFNEAFAAARAQVGPGGVFEWHGKLYGTYYKSEWDALSAEEKQEYQDNIQPHLHDTTPHHTSHEVNHSGDVESQQEVEVQVVEVMHNVDLQGETVDVAAIEVNGVPGIMIDVNQDGYVDIVGVDINQDGQPQEDEFFAVEEPMPMPSMGEDMLVDNTTNMTDDMGPDYMNDAIV